MINGYDPSARVKQSRCDLARSDTDRSDAGGSAGTGTGCRVFAAKAYRYHWRGQTPVAAGGGTWPKAAQALDCSAADGCAGPAVRRLLRRQQWAMTFRPLWIGIDADVTVSGLGTVAADRWAGGFQSGVRVPSALKVGLLWLVTWLSRCSDAVCQST